MGNLDAENFERPLALSVTPEEIMALEPIRDFWQELLAKRPDSKFQAASCTLTGTNSYLVFVDYFEREPESDDATLRRQLFTMKVNSRGLEISPFTNIVLYAYIGGMTCYPDGNGGFHKYNMQY